MTDTLKPVSKRGGKRAGAGRPFKQVINIVPIAGDPKSFLMSVMNDQSIDMRLRIDAAKTLAPFFHARVGEGGKKEEAQNAAKKAITGRFAASSRPRLVTSTNSIPDK